MICLSCGKDTDNPRFCSRSCAATYNNHSSPKRRKHCRHCGLRIHGRRTVCDSCNPSYVDWSTVTIRTMTAKRAYQVHSRIRELARKIYRDSEKPKCCIICGYSIHYEVCHITAIQDFPLDTLISKVNSLDNLIALCPNHHWEFDHATLRLP